MTSLSREVRLLNAKKGYFYFHLMFCEIFFFLEVKRRNYLRRAPTNLSPLNSLKPDPILLAASYLG